MIERYSRPEMVQIWTDENRFNLWLKIEVLALEAMVELGIAPASALETVRKKASFSVLRVLEIEEKVKHDVIAFLTNVAENVGPDARFLHLGMTSSDVLDTALACQLTQATDLLLSSLETLLSSVKSLAEKHKLSLCIGRSHGIHAEPTTFGLKCAGWYAELKRQQSRLKAERETIAVGAISGAVGTFAHLSPKIEQHVCKSLGLKSEAVSTQVIPRDRHAALFSAYAQLSTSLERICIEIRHLQRSEVREAEEFFSIGQKGSSAMPHKRNPVLSENVTGLARLVRAWAGAALENVSLWHERDISHSSVERVIGPDATVTLHFMLYRVNQIVSKLVVYPDNMRRNLELSKGLFFSGTVLVKLAEKGLTREQAYALVQKHALATWDAINSGKELPDDQSFTARMRSDSEVMKVLNSKELEECFSMDAHTKQVDYIFNRVFSEAS